MIARHWQGLLIVLTLTSCAPNLDKMKAGTVRVLCRQGEQISAASGFVIGNGRHVATNWHTVRCSAQSGQAAVLPDRQQLTPARVVWHDPVRDLAILELRQPLDRPVAAFVAGDNVRDDEPVLVLGFPGAADDVGDEVSWMMVKINRGGISAKLRSEQGVGLYQIDAAINPGNSGGRVFDTAGRIIGISVMKSLTVVPTIGPDAQGKLELEFQRVPLAENIAWAVQVDELLPGLRALGLPFTVDTPGLLEPVARLIRQEPVAALVLSVLLFLAAGGLWFYRQHAGISARKASGKTPSSVPRSFRPQLRGLSGPFAGNVLDLPEDALAMGRDLCQLVFPADCSAIGRQHALLRFDAQAERFLLEDCGSANGTFLDSGQRLPPHQPHFLVPGTRFHLSSRAFQFEVVAVKA